MSVEQIRLRLLLDTNVLIPLEDPQIELQASLAKLVQLAQQHGHQLVYHPSSERDIHGDRDAKRRLRTIARLGKYLKLDVRVPCPWNDENTKPNDTVDNEILYALECDAADALITEDRQIHKSARLRGLGKRVYSIQTAEVWLCRLHSTVPVQLPNIDDTELHNITPFLAHPFFDNLRVDYANPPFDDWFRKKAREGRCAWVYWETAQTSLGAICIYASQSNIQITEDGRTLPSALKLCTFKVAPSCQGRKIGELFLKAAFSYALKNRLPYIFIHTRPEKQAYLIDLLEVFGFEKAGMYMGDTVYVKEHPVEAPRIHLPAISYLQRYYPHYRSDEDVRKFIVPIQPRYHRILFPDYEPQLNPEFKFGTHENHAGNAIRQAYLCYAPTKQVRAGDVVLFYRSGDECAVTSLGVVERYETLNQANQIASLVSRRTVYTMEQIAKMSQKPTKVMLFRLVMHLPQIVSHEWLMKHGIVRGNIQSILSINNDAFQQLMGIINV